MPAEEWRLFDCFWFNENALESTLLKFMLELNYRWALNARIKLFSFCFKGRSHNNWNIKYFPERSNIIWPWQHFEYLVDASTPLPEKAMALHSSTLAWKILPKSIRRLSQNDLNTLSLGASGLCDKNTKPLNRTCIHQNFWAIQCHPLLKRISEDSE